MSKCLASDWRIREMFLLSRIEAAAMFTVLEKAALFRMVLGPSIGGRKRLIPLSCCVSKLFGWASTAGMVVSVCVVRGDVKSHSGLVTDTYEWGLVNFWHEAVDVPWRAARIFSGVQLWRSRQG